MALKIRHLILYCIFSCCIGFWWQEKQGFIFFFFGMVTLSAVHFWGYKSLTFTKRELWIYSILLQALLVFTAPFLSDDIYRYLWDGYLWQYGVNPYLNPPQAFTDSILSSGFESYKKINHPQFATVYPPLPEALFWLNALMGNTIVGLKLIWFVLGLGVCYLLQKVDELHKLNGKLFYFVALHPLYLLEVFSSGHFDVLVLLGLLLLYQKKNVLTSFGYLIAVISRVHSIFYGWLFASKNRTLTASLCVFVLGFLWYLGNIENGGAVTYTKNWHFNNLIYETLRQLCLPYYHSISSVLEFSLFLRSVLFIFVSIFIWRTYMLPKSLEERICYIHLVLMSLSPTVYPWYFVGVLPFFLLAKSDFLLMWSYTVLWSYYILKGYFSSGIWEESYVILSLEYIVPFLYFLGKRNRLYN